jgi:uncharacterized protein YggE
MKKLLFLLCCISLSINGQNPIQEKPFIEVTGTSETEVVPDIIEVTITLQEYVEGKSKMDIGKQEENLRTQLNDLGIDSKQLTLVTAVADYQKIRMMKKDVVNSKTYLLKLSTAEMVGKVYERLDLIDVHYARISRLDHTKILDFQKENRIKAMKAAKEKAEYLLSAIGKTAGNPLQVLEGENWVDNGPQGPRPGIMYKNAMQSMESFDKEVEEPISMRKIKIRSGYSVKFEIK